MLNSGSRPAACHVEPEVSSLRSSRTTSDQPFLTRAYSVPTPTTPPPITTTRACDFMDGSFQGRKRCIRQHSGGAWTSAARGDFRDLDCDTLIYLRLRSRRHDRRMSGQAEAISFGLKPDAAAQVQAWLGGFARRRRAAAKTIEAYARDLTQFGRFLQDH